VGDITSQQPRSVEELRKALEKRDTVIERKEGEIKQLRKENDYKDEQNAQLRKENEEQARRIKELEALLRTK